MLICDFFFLEIMSLKCKNIYTRKADRYYNQNTVEHIIAVRTSKIVIDLISLKCITGWLICCCTFPTCVETLSAVE